MNIIIDIEASSSYRSCYVNDVKYSIGDFVLVDVDTEHFIDSRNRIARIEAIHDIGEDRPEEERVYASVTWFIKRDEIPLVSQGKRELLMDKRKKQDCLMNVANIQYKCDVVHKNDLENKSKDTLYYEYSYNGKEKKILEQDDLRPTYKFLHTKSPDAKKSEAKENMQKLLVSTPAEKSKPVERKSGRVASLTPNDRRLSRRTLPVSASLTKQFSQGSPSTASKRKSIAVPTTSCNDSTPEKRYKNDAEKSGSKNTKDSDISVPVGSLNESSKKGKLLISGDLTVDLFDIDTASVSSSSSISSHSTKNSSQDKHSRSRKSLKADKIVPHTRYVSSSHTNGSTTVDSPLYASHPRSVRKSKRLTEESTKPVDRKQLTSKTVSKPLRPQKSLIEEVVYVDKDVSFNNSPSGSAEITRKSPRKQDKTRSATSSFDPYEFTSEGELSPVKVSKSRTPHAKVSKLNDKLSSKLTKSLSSERSQSPEFPSEVSADDTLEVSVLRLQLDSIKSLVDEADGKSKAETPAELDQLKQDNLRRSSRKSVISEKKTPKHDAQKKVLCTDDEDDVFYSKPADEIDISSGDESAIISRKTRSAKKRLENIPKSESSSKAESVAVEAGLRRSSRKSVSVIKNTEEQSQVKKSRSGRRKIVKKLNLSRQKTPEQHKDKKTLGSRHASLKRTPGRTCKRNVSYTDDTAKVSKSFDIDDSDDDPNKEFSIGELSESSSDDSDESSKEVTKQKKKRASGRRSVRPSRSILAQATPSIQRRHKPVLDSGTALERARAQLHVSVVPDSLPCREEEFANILSYVESKLQSGNGGCLYISGVPGTGKTATVYEAMRFLEQAREKNQMPDFQFVEVNGMRLTQPYQAFSNIYKCLTNKKVTAEHATTLLDKMFSKSRSQNSIVLLVDELDLLMTRKQDVLYNLFDWPTKPHSKLIVLAIANTMDLPERVMMNRVSSRLGLNRMTFQPYTFQQLQEIVHSRLKGIVAFDPDAIQLASRKVAAVSGDARRALDICRRATEVAEAKNDTSVNMLHVNTALHEMFSSPKITAIRDCTVYEKLVLKCILAEFTRSGLEEASLLQVYRHLPAICSMDGNPTIKMSHMLLICSNLNNMKLILVESNGTGIHQRVRLNVSQDDVQYALKDETTPE